MPYQLIGNNINEALSKDNLQSDAIPAWYGYKQRAAPSSEEAEDPTRIVAIWSIAPLNACAFASVVFHADGSITDEVNSAPITLAAMRALVLALPPNGNFLELEEADYDIIADMMFPA